MRNMSLEKTRQREQELVQEADRLQNEIKLLQKSSEDSANISQQLSKDVSTSDVYIIHFANIFAQCTNELLVSILQIDTGKVKRKNTHFNKCTSHRLLEKASIVKF